MIVYKYFLKLAYRLKSYAIIFLVIFMGMGLSQVLGNQEVTGFQDTKYKVVIKDESEGNSDIINAMTASLKKDHKVTLTTNSDNSMKEAVYANDADGAIWIPSDVDARINKGEEALNMEIGNSLEGNLLREYVNSYIRYAVVLKNQGKFSAENMDKILKEQATVSVISKDATVKDADYYAKFGEIYFSYTPFVYISVFIFLLGLIFALLEKDEVAKRIIIGMKSVNRVTFEKFLGGLTVVGIIVGINLVFVAILAPSFYVSAGAPKSLMLTISMALTAYALAFLCSVIIGDNRYGYSAASTVVGMGLSFISGIFVPLSLLNPVAISIAKFFPVYYVISAAENPSTDFSSYAFNLGMVLLFGILYVALAFSIQQIRTRQFGRSLKKA